MHFRKKMRPASVQSFLKNILIEKDMLRVVHCTDWFKQCLLTVPRRCFFCTSFVDNLCCFCLVLLCFYTRLFVDACWSPAGKGLTSWLSFVMPNCDVVTFPLVSSVRCGA